MMNRFTKLIQLIERQCSWSGGSNRNHNKTARYERRRLFLEPLQSREVMAVAVEAFMPTPSGFVAELSAEIQQDVLNLYDTESGALGAADVTLVGNVTGNVPGSLVVEGTTLTFIATGGALPTDTYTVTMRSASDGIVDQVLGESLDGEFDGSFPSGNGIAGGDFTTTFAVATNPLVVSIPDFARGPTQAVQVPAMGSGAELPAGLPIQLSNADGVTSFTLTVAYDPALLTITGAELGADAPSGSQVQINLDTPGQATIAFFALDPMTSGPADVVSLVAEVPESATYGATQVVDITLLEVNAGGLQATADDGLHVVAFPGDANANRRYDAEDARLIARTGIGLDTGFVTSTPTTTSTASLLFPSVDAAIIGDVTGVDGLSPLDASDILRRVVGLSTPNIPPLPTAQSPTNLSLSSTTVLENQPSGTLVGTFASTDPDMGDSFTYSLVAGTGDTDNALFSISGATLQTAVEFDHASQQTLSVRVRTTDSTGRFFEKAFTISVTDINEAPTSVAISNDTIAEEIAIGTPVGILTTGDPDANNSFTYSLASGTGDTDNAFFTIVNDELQVAAAVDFETQSSYSVLVRSTDQGGLSVDQILTIVVTDVNEAPTAVALSNSTVQEAQSIGALVGVLTTTDQDSGDSHTYSLVAGDGDADNASFTIDGDELLTAEVFDFNTQASYTVRVQSMDAGGLTFEQVITISITEVNVAPTAVSLDSTSVDENLSIGTVVGMLSTTDANSTDTHTYSFVAGDGDSDNATFAINGDQLLTAADIDFETQSSYTIRVQSMDQDGLSVEQMLTIDVNGVNETPTAVSLSNDTIAEDAASGSVVGAMTTVDPDSGDTFTYTLVAGEGDTDNASFAIVNDELQTAVALDFETQSSYMVRVQSMDQDGLSVERMLTISVSDVNETPTALAISNSTVAEAEPSGTVVGILTTSDVDAGDTFTYSLVAGDGDTDNASFAISGDELQTTEVFDQATKDTYSIRVSTMDAGGLMFEQVLTITISETNVAPTAASLDSTSVDENVSLGTVVGTFSTTDANSTDTHTYTFVGGDGDTDNAAFTIDGDQLLTAADVDFETQASYSIRVQSTDTYGLSVEQMLTIDVNDVNETPTAANLSNDTIAEDATSGSVVGTLTTVDPDSGDTFTYTLVAGEGDTDNASFTIVNDELQTAVALDFETQSSYSVRVQSMDQDGLSAEQMLTISVTDVNEAPTALAISNSTVAEAEPSGTVVGMLTTSDVDAGDTFTYSLVAGDGDTDNASFAISGDELQTTEVFDQATKDTYSVRVSTMDAGGLTFERVLTITISEANVAPSALAIDATTVDENSDVGTVVGMFSTTDANAADTHSYELVAGEGDTDNASFAIDGEALLTAVAIDFETQSSYSIRVRSTDRYGLSMEEMFSVTVNDLNEAPTALALSNDTVEETSPVGTVVGMFSTTDPESGDTFTYSLVEGDGDTDNATFTIDGDELKTAELCDCGINITYSIRVQSMDQDGLAIEQNFTIAVVQPNVAPTAVALSSSSIDENEAPGTEVGTLTSADANEGDTHTYALVAGTGDTDNALFSIAVDQLFADASFDFESQDAYSIRVQSTDSSGLSVEQTLMVTVNDLNETPTDLMLSNDTVVEDAMVGTVVGLLSTADPDSGNTHSYSLVAGEGDTDNGSFEIVGDELRTAVTLNFATQSSYSIRVQSMDQGGELFEKVLTVLVSELSA
ncbi:MAG: cadherin domain-containing protein [Planctomycetaceae bacterium]|nr:cadherin domain-containing protein [Planctomycetales bacterium]MCB9927088.1 cadherin domain-containing protein [Planctomycetaceae bacterium]